MTTSLSNTTALLASSEFRERVKAAMTEEALVVAAETGGEFAARRTRSKLADAVIFDADAHVAPFARLCADDTVISAVTVPAEVDDGDIRRVVQARWTAVAAAVPNL